MQRDFHYYCIGVLAKAAGFDSKDALTIAYASQYVDDSTESEPIKIEFQDTILPFDPVRTAHIGLRSMDWSVQKRVYLPFHFLPPEPFDQNGSFSFVTIPDSEFSRLLLKRAESEPLRNWTRRLCRIGIALHTYADTWSHHRFSGRQSKLENDVESINVFDRSKSKYKKLIIGNIVHDIAPEIGHVEAGFFPDMAFLAWNYKSRTSKNKYVPRDNLNEFLGAGKTIYDWLLSTEKRNGTQPIPWANIEPDIQGLLESKGDDYKDKDADSRCEKWEDKFKQLFGNEKFSYDRMAWREEALEGDVDWDEYRERDWAGASPYKQRPGFWNSRWVHFHRAALSQRHFVLENLP